MTDGTGKVVINLATGHEDADRVTVAFLVATAALERGRPVAMFATKEAVRLGLPGYAQAVESAVSPPVARLFDQFGEGGGWIAGTKESRVLEIMPYLQRGFAAVNVEYRMAQVSLAPAAVEDC